jgi:hypothetical protein
MSIYYCTDSRQKVFVGGGWGGRLWCLKPQKECSILIITYEKYFNFRFLFNQLEIFARLRSMVWFMVLDATFNNISAISWQSILLVKETGVPRENHRPVASQ